MICIYGKGIYSHFNFIGRCYNQYWIMQFIPLKEAENGE